MNNLEACLTPAIFSEYEDGEAIIVIIDTLRASSAICWALHNGAEKLIPVATVEEASKFKKSGYMVAAERDGLVLDFADFGNSPFNFTAQLVEGKTIVYSTTNGTRCINLASKCYHVVIGSFLNISAIERWLVKSDRNVILLCAGWRNRINIEDSLFAGALAKRLLDSGRYETKCDSVKIVLDMWEKAGDNLLGYIEKAAQRSRLRDKGLDDCIPFCHTPDSTDVIPILSNGSLVKLDQIN
ncbi:MAG TPA: 2-phosphosulfolactate phosphatase [Bacteroidales bacterium]|nr:2-phosphosulfolactate phosphatase [Bacteroidales bacterium]